MLGILLREITDRLQPGGYVGGRLQMIAEAPWERVTVYREFVLIDVVVEILSAQGVAVIGIENKIDAAEQPLQISRYQQALLRAFPGPTAVVAFLTPTGLEPTTARSESAVPAVAIGYDRVLRGVQEARREARSGRRDERVLSQVAAHLEENILGDPEVNSAVGLVLSVISILMMPALAYGKQRTGREMGSSALQADAVETWVCSYSTFHS
jgi:hypothetical protein